MTRRRIVSAVVALGLVVLPHLTRAAAADEITVLCSNGLKAVVEDLAPKFEGTTHHKLVVKYGLAASLRQRIKDGEAFDVAFVTPAVMDDLIADGRISRDTRATVARSGLALAIRTGTRKPDIGTADAFKRALVNAKSIAYAKEGASGVLFAALIQRLGIANDLQTKSRLTATGEAVSAAVERLKERGLTSPYLKAFVVARINPLRFIKGDPPPFDELLATMTKRARGMDPCKIRSEDLARSGGPPDE